MAVPLLPVPLLSFLLSWDFRPSDGDGIPVPEHPIPSNGECEVLVVPLLTVPLIAFLLSVHLRPRTQVMLSACVPYSDPPLPPQPSL